MQVAPALGISVWALWMVWGRYTKVVDDRQTDHINNTAYHRENDKENLLLMVEFRQLLTTLITNTEQTKTTLSKEIHEKAESIKSHLDDLIRQKNDRIS
jgi:hypothetical protein